MAHYIIFGLIVIAGTLGELCVSRTMQIVGEVPSFHPADISRLIVKALRVSWMWLGVGMMAVAFFALLAALTTYNVSFVVPVTALSYVTGALGGAAFLRERIGSGRWLGILLVTIGVTLVFLGKS
ncbi:MAG TPA: EamA family transporter [Bryobacteraceae bacterium]|nr:EamA family transporter [Bryobacteraceae bacterium]